MDAVAYSFAAKVYDKLVAPPAYKGEAAATPYTSDATWDFAEGMSDGKIYWCGQRTDSASTVREFRAYDPVTDTWTTKASVGSNGVFYNAIMFANEAKTIINVLTENGRGGWIRYNITTNTWSTVNASFDKWPITGITQCYRRPGTSQVHVVRWNESSHYVLDDVALTLTTKPVVPNNARTSAPSGWIGDTFWISHDTAGAGKGRAPYNPTTNTYGAQSLTQSFGTYMGVGVSNGTSIYAFGHNSNSTFYGVYFKVNGATYEEPFGDENYNAVPAAIWGVAVWDPTLSGRIHWFGPAINNSPSAGTTKHYMIDVVNVPDADAATLLAWLASQ